MLRCSADRVPLRLRVLAADRCGWPRPPRRGLLCCRCLGSPSLARVQRPWQGRHLGYLRTPIREAGPPQSLGVTGARTEVVLRAERPRRHQAASRVESELHAARGLYPRPGPARRRKGPGAQGAGVGRGQRRGRGQGQARGRDRGGGRTRRRSGPRARLRSPRACHRPGSPSALPGPRVPTWASPCYYMSPCPVWRRHRLKKGVTQLGCGAGSRGAQPHPTARGLSA